MRKVTIKIITIGLVAFSLLNFPGNLLAWEGKPTHKVLTNYAADNSILSVTKGDYLKNLGFTNGLDERFTWKKFLSVKEWLQEGSAFEDAGNIFQVVTGNGRFMNHFHDPLKEWESAGLDDWVLFLHYTGDSSVLWAQNGDNQLNFPEGNWSWKQIRDFYYFALTSNTEEERQEYFAKTFRGLGHQMHLIQDAAVPAHVRNDAHPFAYNRMMGLHIEKWAAEKYNRNYVNSLAENPSFPAVELNTSYQTFAPITQFIDTIGANKYDGSNPSTSLSIGLAEYANANFFSDDTIFTEDYSTDHRHYFPYPKKSSTNLQDYLAQTPLPETRMAQDGVEDLVLPHIIKNNDGENINHFVRPGYYTNHYSGEGDATYYRTFYIDEQCHKDYAAKLIPRAVGYSAGLLDYFFRGAIEITLPDNGVYALTDLGPDLIDPSQQGFDHITLLAQNTAPEGEEMTGGTVTLVVKYKVGEGDQFQNPPAATSDEFHYIVKELGGTHSIPRDTPTLFEFDISANQIPLWATDVYINLVYKGNLGGEEETIAVGFKDISEPTPINYYNVMDKICMDAQLFDSGSTAAIDYVDTDGNGIADHDEWDVYPHNAANIHIRFSPVDNPQAATSASSSDNNYEKAILNPNDYFRLFILSDHRFNRSASVEYVKITAEDQCDQFHGTFPRPPTAMDGIKNQTDLVDPVNCGYEPCYARLIPGFHTTRGVVSFFSVIFDNASNPIDSICSYED